MPDGLREIALSPGMVLALLVGAFHASTYLLIRGRAGWHLLVVLPAACAGALVGQVASTRLGDLLWIGEFGLIWASVGAWGGIGLVLLVLAVRPRGRRADSDRGDIRPRGQRP
ncbi:hypothetical protein BH23CHL8_BH23CHL8_30780 [soil metagenome]